MNRTRVLLGAAAAVLLSGCMAMGGVHGTEAYLHDGHGYGYTGQVQPSWQRVEAEVGDLAISLSFPTASMGAVVPIDVWLGTETEGELTDPNVRLWIHTPDQGIDQLRMDRVESAPPGLYQARYRFRTAGRYVLTAEGGEGSGAEARTVSVTAEADVHEGAYGDHHWLAHPAFWGSVSMVAMMSLMMVLH